MAKLRKAIDLKCKECIYDKYALGTWRKQVEECSSPNCSLYDVRPLQICHKNGEKMGKIRTEGNNCIELNAVQPKARLLRGQNQNLTIFEEV